MNSLWNMIKFFDQFVWFFILFILFFLYNYTFLLSFFFFLHFFQPSNQSIQHKWKAIQSKNNKIPNLKKIIQTAASMKICFFFSMFIPSHFFIIHSEIEILVASPHLSLHHSHFFLLLLFLNFWKDFVVYPL